MVILVPLCFYFIFRWLCTVQKIYHSLAHRQRTNVRFIIIIIRDDIDASHKQRINTNIKQERKKHTLFAYIAATSYLPFLRPYLAGAFFLLLLLLPHLLIFCPHSNSIFMPLLRNAVSLLFCSCLSRCTTDYRQLSTVQFVLEFG